MSGKNLDKKYSNSIEGTKIYTFPESRELDALRCNHIFLIYREGLYMWAKSLILKNIFSLKNQKNGQIQLIDQCSRFYVIVVDFYDCQEIDKKKLSFSGDDFGIFIFCSKKKRNSILVLISTFMFFHFKVTTVSLVTSLDSHDKVVNGFINLILLLIHVGNGLSDFLDPFIPICCTIYFFSKNKDTKIVPRKA